MSKRAEYHVTARFSVVVETLPLIRGICSPSEKYCWVSVGGGFKERLRVHTLRGVPGKMCDLLLPDHDTPSEGFTLVCEIGKKTGCYDASQRWRITIRQWPTSLLVSAGKNPTLSHPGPGRIHVSECDEGLIVEALWKPDGFWANLFHQLRFVVDDRTKLRNIVLGQYHGYYRFLHLYEEDVEQLADYWASLPAVKEQRDIVVLNRWASQALYDLAKQLGWRKLTQKDKKRYGLSPDSQQWQRADGIILRPNGVGEYTQRAANGDQDYIRTAYGTVNET